MDFGEKLMLVREKMSGAVFRVGEGEESRLSFQWRDELIESIYIIFCF
jgi:hypothetical protein